MFVDFRDIQDRIDALERQTDLAAAEVGSGMYVLMLGVALAGIGALMKISDGDPPPVKWMPTHLTPEAPLAAWMESDPSAQQLPAFGPDLPLRVTERRGAWARVVTEAGGQAWVDGRKLVEFEPPPPPDVDEPPPSPPDPPAPGQG